MTLPMRPPIPPMLAHTATEVPRGDYLYEPKWDGFRALVFKDGDRLFLQSRNAKPLNRYFPELCDGLLRVAPPRCVLDGEIVIVGSAGLDFDSLLLRIHPAPSRVARLSEATPASFVAFDLLALGDEDLRDRPFLERRARLVRACTAGPPLYVTPSTRDVAAARSWFERFEGAGLDGVVVKAASLPYVAGERMMLKVKHRRTADCVVGGYRVGRDHHGLASLLLGLYDDEGLLQHVGVATGMSFADRGKLAEIMAPLRTPGPHPWLVFEGPPPGQPWRRQVQRVPGAQTRWNRDESLAWIAVQPKKVVEVAYDHLQGDRFRHPARFIRLRPDREPRSCTYAQLEVVVPAELQQVFQQAASAPS